MPTQAKDYSKSAINLCNPDEVRDLLIEKSRFEALVMSCQEELGNDETYLQLQDHQKALSDLDKQIREAVEKHGSYQDTENERYGVRYTRVSKVYHVEPFKEHYLKFVSAVVEETINTKALDGIVKGGLIEEADLKMHKVITEDVGYAYYIR